ncbi:hypothetical protein JK356_06810 [Streptomyces sp. 7-21]|nr:hypothetical protein [Streptomyces sp. 7-21]
MAAYLIGTVAALGAAGYVVVYLYRWQWQRAILCGVLLLVVEVLLLGLALFDRIARLERALLRDRDRGRDRGADAGPPGTAAGTGEAGGAPRFAWLEQAMDRERHTFVFVPVLMAAGVALSGVAWAVERVARAAMGARPAAGRRLAVLAPPPPPGEAPELPPRPPLGPPRQPWRRLRRLAGWALLAAVCAGLVTGLARLTQTRPPEHGDAGATTLLFTVEVRGISDEQATLAARQQWERCRDATSLPLANAGMSVLGDGLFAVTIHPSLTAHDTHRLRGCLEDATVDRIRLRVVAAGDASP